MASKIEWTNETWNPVSGCSKVSDGCKNCYAERMSKRLAGRCGYPADEPFRVTLHPDRLEQPLHWRDPRMIFPCSMSDLFHEAVPFDFIQKVFAVMAIAKQHTFQVLTKRPSRMLEFSHKLGELSYDGPGSLIALGSWFGKKSIKRPWPLPNVWLGVTCENQKAADERIPLLLQCPAAVRFVSYEPALGPLVIPDVIEAGPNGRDGIWMDPLRPNNPNAINWIICGGESGPGARKEGSTDNIRNVVQQCKDADVPVFVKQLWLTGCRKCGFRPCTHLHGHRPKDFLVKDVELFPEDLRVREFPRKEGE